MYSLNPRPFDTVSLKSLQQFIKQYLKSFNSLHLNFVSRDISFLDFVCVYFERTSHWVRCFHGCKPKPLYVIRRLKPQQRTTFKQPMWSDSQHSMHLVVKALELQETAIVEEVHLHDEPKLLHY